MMASLYPAASVIPHAVTVDDPAAHLADSQAVFDVLRKDPVFGVRQQLHFEMFEPGARPGSVSDPPYVRALRDFAPCTAPIAEASGDARAFSPTPPLRSGAVSASGWRYTVTFVETPTYVRALFALFEALGGVVRQQQITRERVVQLPGDLLINALGGRAPDIFPDPRPASYLRGVLLLVDSPGLPEHRDVGRPVSYNYTPDPSVYAIEDGSAAGVYAYRRRDVWVLGGSKQEGRIIGGEWQGESVTADTFSVPGIDGGPAVEVPRPVLDLNDQLLRDLTGVSIRDRGMRATFGYRYARDLDGDGVRLGTTQTRDGRPVVHNTGHGGAGVTLSWSCALRVAHTISAIGERHPSGDSTSEEDSTAPIAPALRRRLRERLKNINASSDHAASR